MRLIPSSELVKTEEFYFTFDNVRYHAEIGLPRDGQPTKTVVIVPGHGQTDFVGGSQFYQLKQFFTQLGFATLVWDKKGCGKSEGVYEHHQSVQSSAREVAAALAALKVKNKVITQTTGIWGISRAGWIAPLVISEDPEIDFWISVSGTDQLDNFRYLIERNLIVEGRARSYVAEIMKEWDYYIKTLRGGEESYDQMVQNTSKLFSDSLLMSLGVTRVTLKDFEDSRSYYKTSEEKFDEATGVRIMLPDFDKILMKVKCPTLAIFGELDSQVNWRRTVDLYKNTLGKKRNGTTEIAVLPNCNHSIMTCETGALFENLDKFNGAVCDGYYEKMREWLTSVAGVR